MDKDAVNYAGPRVEDKDDPTLSYFYMNGIWYSQHKYVPVNLPCDDKPPPAHVVKEWMKKHGNQQGGLKATTSTTPQQLKQKIIKPAKTKLVKRKHSIGEDDDLPKNKKHRLTAGMHMESSSTSVPLGPHSSKQFNKRTVEPPAPIKPLSKSFNKIDSSVLHQSTSSGKKSLHKMPYVEPQPSPHTTKMPSEQKQSMPTLNAPTERVAPTKANESGPRPIMITTTGQLIKEASTFWAK
uniref:Tudor domain-containing protein n=1 Tax=Globodera pallida TaxID=36090 RepID=A0A183BRE4_GLOPA